MATTSIADRQRYWREVIERQRASGQSIGRYQIVFGDLRAETVTAERLRAVEGK